MAAGIFMRVGTGTRDVPQDGIIGEGRGTDCLQHGGWQADIGQHRLSAQVAPRKQQMARLQPEERYREFRVRCISTYGTRAAIHTARHIDRYHAPGSGQGVRRDSIDIAREARAENRVNDQIGPPRLVRRKRRRSPVPSAGGAGRIGPGPGRAKGRQTHRPAFLLQQPRDNITIAAVVAWPGQDQRAARPESTSDGTRDRPPGILHQHRAGHAEGGSGRIGAAHLLRGQQFGVTGAVHSVVTNRQRRDPGRRTVRLSLACAATMCRADPPPAEISLLRPPSLPPARARWCAAVTANAAADRGTDRPPA
jgi:hypothetical protein